MSKSVKRTPPDLALIKPQLNEASLLVLMGAANKTLSAETAHQYFQHSKRLQKTFRGTIERLQSQGLVEDIGGEHYKIKQRWADMAYGVITEDTDKYGNSFVRIKNLPKSYPLKTTISKKQVDKYKLKPGMSVLIQVTQGRSPFHQTAHLIEQVERGATATLSGKFKLLNGEPRFFSGYKSIKTPFNLHAASKADMEHNTRCFAMIPLDYDMRRPRILVAPDQDTLPGSNVKITDILARKYNLDKPFTERSLAEADRLKYHHVPQSNRIDLSEINSFSIDPPGAQDLDDMLYAERIAGGWRSITQIADVTELVHYGSEIDRAAYSRGNTVYLPGNAYHMLPSSLVEKCSLLPNSERPVLYAETFYDDEGNIQEENLGFGVGRSKAKLSYGQYDDLVAKRDPLVWDLAELHETLRLNAQRLNTDKVKDSLLHADGSMFFGKTTVETAMVHMNALMAKTLHSNDIPTLYRNNGPTLDIELYRKTRETLQELELALPENPVDCDADAIKKVFDEALMRGLHERVAPLMNFNLLDRAFYSPVSQGHFALRMQFYTHGTSPIRRYADIVVHRGMRTLKGMDHGLDKKEIKRLQSTATHLDSKKQLDKDLSYDHKHFHAIGDLKRMEGMTMSASIARINAGSIEIVLHRDGLAHRITKEKLETLGYSIERHGQEMIVRNTATQQTYRRDDKLRGLIRDVKPHEALWTFEPVPPATGKAPAPDLTTSLVL